MCGFTLSDALRTPKRARFRGLAEFVVCQFELNLLNQAIYTHAADSFLAWRAFSVPFADTHKCSSGHGLVHLPYSIIRFAQQPNASTDISPVSLTWDILRGYTTFFLEDYLTRFVTGEQSVRFPRETVFKAVAVDRDCTAYILSPSGWESKNVMGLLAT
jgi:hypothetical protein